MYIGPVILKINKTENEKQVFFHNKYSFTMPQALISSDTTDNIILQQYTDWSVDTGHWIHNIAAILMLSPHDCFISCRHGQNFNICNFTPNYNHIRVCPKQNITFFRPRFLPVRYSKYFCSVENGSPPTVKLSQSMSQLACLSLSFKINETLSKVHFKGTRI